MNPSQAQGQGSGGQQPKPPQARPPTIFRPEQMRSLPDDLFSADKKIKWESGLIGLYKAMETNPPDSREYMDARNKAQEFSDNLRGKMQLARAQAAQAAQGQSRQPNQGGATARQNDGRAPNQSTAQQARPSAVQPKLSEQLMHHISTFPYVIPTQYALGSPEAIKWLSDAKQKYGKALMAMENSASHLRTLDNMVKERGEQGKPLNENEQRDYALKKEGYQKQHLEAKRFTEGFRKDQEQKAEMAQQKAGNRTAAAGQPVGNPSQQVPNQVQQTTETMNSAMQAARNQQMHGGRPNMAGNGQKNEQTAQAVSGTLHNTASNPSNSQAQNVNIKVEGGTNPPQVNTAIATAPHLQQQHSRQQNSPQSSVPQSATSNGPPRPLSHPAALAHAARTYSSTQTSGTPNVMGAASHAHPSAPRETPNINTNKMPIGKYLPENSLAIPSPVPMQPSRPTMTGGPTNAGSGLMGQPVLQKTPGFNLEGEGERVLNKRKLDELVRQVTGGGEGLDSAEGLTPEVEDCVLSVADEFVDQVITAACKCAKARGSKTLEIRDLQLILERNYNIRIPGYASDEIRTVRKFQPAQGWIAKMSAIQAAKLTGGKGDS